MNKCFKANSTLQRTKYILLFFKTKIRQILHTFHPLAQPGNNLRGTNIKVFNTYREAIGILKMLENITQTGRADANLTPCLKNSIQITLLQTEILDIKSRKILTTSSYRISFGIEMTPLPITMNQVDNIKLLAYILALLRTEVCTGKVESFKELFEACIYRGRILKVLLIQ